MATYDVIVLCVTVFIIGMVVGILLIVTADDDYEEVMDYMYNLGFEDGYRKGMNANHEQMRI